MVQQRQRPTGVTVLAILAFIGGILLIIAGLGSFSLSATLGGFFGALGVILLITGVLELVLGYGFWTLKPWAWTLGMALEVIGIIEALIYIAKGVSVGSQVIDILISAGIIYYLTRPHVRQVFGRA